MPTSLHACRQKETPKGRKSKRVLHPSGRDYADRKAEEGQPKTQAEKISAALGAWGGGFRDETWDFLPDGSALCMATRETLLPADVPAFRARLGRLAEGCGILVDGVQVLGGCNTKPSPST